MYFVHLFVSSEIANITAIISKSPSASYGEEGKNLSGTKLLMVQLALHMYSLPLLGMMEQSFLLGGALDLLP